MLRQSSPLSGHDVQSKAIGRVTGRGQARELMERVLAEAAGDVPVDSSYDGICRFILLNIVSVVDIIHLNLAIKVHPVQD